MFRGLVVQVEWLRIELGGEALDVGFRDLNLPALEAHSDFEIFKPLGHFFALQLRPRASHPV